MTNKYNNVLYTGVTNILERRVYEHKNKLIPGFTAKDNVTKLVHQAIRYLKALRRFAEAVSLTKL
jgi:putative endonuclease